MSVPALKQPGEAILEPTLSGDGWVTTHLRADKRWKGNSVQLTSKWEFLFMC
jgi:hypothetical protein